MRTRVEPRTYELTVTTTCPSGPNAGRDPVPSKRDRPASPHPGEVQRRDAVDLVESHIGALFDADEVGDTVRPDHRSAGNCRHAARPRIRQPNAVRERAIGGHDDEATFRGGLTLRDHVAEGPCHRQDEVVADHPPGHVEVGQLHRPPREGATGRIERKGGDRIEQVPSILERADGPDRAVGDRQEEPARGRAGDLDRPPGDGDVRRGRNGSGPIHQDLGSRRRAFRSVPEPSARLRPVQVRGRGPGAKPMPADAATARPADRSIRVSARGAIPAAKQAAGGARRAGRGRTRGRTTGGEERRDDHEHERTKQSAHRSPPSARLVGRHGPEREVVRLAVRSARGRPVGRRRRCPKDPGQTPRPAT